MSQWKEGEKFYSGIVTNEYDGGFDVLWNDKVKTSYADKAFKAARTISSFDEIQYSNALYILDSTIST